MTTINSLIHSYRQNTSYSGPLARKAKSTKAFEPTPYPGADVWNYSSIIGGTLRSRMEALDHPQLTSDAQRGIDILMIVTMANSSHSFLTQSGGH